MCNGLPSAVRLSFSHVDATIQRDVIEYRRVQNLGSDQFEKELRAKNINCAKNLSVLMYPDGINTYQSVLDRALHTIIMDPIGRELLNVLCTKLNRKFEVWNAIICGASNHRSSVLTGIANFKKKSINRTNFTGILGAACDFIRCVLLPQRPDDVVRSAMATAVQFSFDPMDDRRIYSQVRSVYSTSNDLSLNGDRIQNEILAVPHAAMHNVYYSLFESTDTLSSVAKGVMNVLDRFLDTAYKAREFDFTFEVVDFHKCCFIPSASGRSMVCLNFADYDPVTFLSSGEYSVVPDNSGLDMFCLVEKVKKDLYQAVFHESDHFLHFAEGIIRGADRRALRIVFGLEDALGGSISGLTVGDIDSRNEIVKRWTNDEEFATILGIHVDAGGNVFFDRLSNAGFMWSRDRKVRIWHIVTESLLLTELEDQIMREVLEFIESNI